MPKNMNYEEYSKYFTLVIERIAEKKKAKEVAEARFPEMDSERIYTIDDAVEAVSIASPGDRELALQAIDEIETRIRPRALLSSINEKLDYYDNLSKAKGELVFKSSYFSDSIEPDLLYLATQGVLELEDVNKYIQESRVLNMVLTDKVPSCIKDRNTEKAAYRGFFSTLLGGGGLIMAASYLLLPLGYSVNISMLGFFSSGVIGIYVSSLAEKSVARKNEREARERMKEYESDFGFNMMGLEAMIIGMNGQINSEKVMVYNPEDEKKVIIAVLNARKYFKNALAAIPEISKCYLSLKEAEAGLPIQEMKTPLLTAKPINTDKK